MSIQTFIQGKCKQTAVYWGSPVNDGRGKYTFDVIEEVLVRWEDETENFAKDSRSRIQIGKDGREFRTNAKVFTANAPTGGWNLDGYMFLGTLSDLQNSASPYGITGAWEIKQINPIPSLNDPSVVTYEIYL